MVTAPLLLTDAFSIFELTLVVVVVEASGCAIVLASFLQACAVMMNNRAVKQAVVIFFMIPSFAIYKQKTVPSFHKKRKMYLFAFIFNSAYGG